MKMIEELSNKYEKYKNNFVFDEASNIEFDEIGSFTTTLVNSNNKYYIFVIYSDNNKIIFKALYLKSKKNLSDEYNRFVDDIKNNDIDSFLDKYYEKLMLNYK